MIDDTTETRLHIMRVRELIQEICIALLVRGQFHDESKLEHPEREAFAAAEELRSLPFPSKEYDECKKKFGIALEHHYRENRHHPEHFSNGIADMNLIDLIEMLADWRAATERHEDGDINKSIKHNAQRFKISQQLQSIMENTVKGMGW